METDYILIAVDAEKKCAIRFLSLAHTLKQSLEIQSPGPGIRQTYAEFLLASAILGSRLDEQESILFKLKYPAVDLSINCEVSPKGSMRSAIFPPELKNVEDFERSGLLKVVRLNKGNEVYESVVDIGDEPVEHIIRKYLQTSVQTESLFFLNADTTNFQNNFALWIEKLPGTSDEDWARLAAKFSKPGMFRQSFADTDDPDRIIARLFDEPIHILAVTHPKLTCSCSKEKIMSALKLLSPEDLADIFMQGQGAETQCDYCGKVWNISDDEIKSLLNVNRTLH